MGAKKATKAINIGKTFFIIIIVVFINKCKETKYLPNYPQLLLTKCYTIKYLFLIVLNKYFICSHFSLFFDKTIDFKRCFRHSKISR